MTTTSPGGSTSSVPRMPTPEEVGAWLDTYAVFCDLVLGRSHHAGAWGPKDTPEREAAGGASARERLWQAQGRLVDRLARLLDLRRDARVLDVGCGTGRTALQLAGEFGVRVTGCTVSRSQVAAANERAREAGLADRVSFEYGDGMNLPYPDAAFDAVWAVESFDHMSDWPWAFGEVRRVLRPGGQALVSVNSMRAELNDTEIAVWRDGFEVCPPRPPAALADAARAAGLRVESLLEPYEDFQVVRTWHLWQDLYQENHPALLDQYGPDTTALMDFGIAALYAILTQKIGYAVVVVRRAEEDARDTPEQPTATQVGEWYDQFSDFFDTALGRSFHSGIFPPEHELPASATVAAVSLSQERMVDYLTGLLAPTAGGRHLDVGSGTGNSALQLAQRHGLDVTGANISRVQIAQATERAARAGLADRVRFRFADAMDLPFPAGTFDSAWAVESFEHVGDRAAALRGMSRVLRPGGRALVAMMTRRQEFTETEDQMWQQGFRLCPLPSVAEFSATATGAGFTVEQVLEPQDELRIDHTWTLWLQLYRNNRAALVQRYGEDFIGLMDVGCPMILNIYRDRCWYAVFLLRKPSPAAR
ncbi:SAM-dependent methyltransferase [Amycolatopsis sacchari]|uniref:SAM-dependent methyltransferase n=1 Tax=Amycolatopsis sacchari TaxID=115433 RepID=UPI003D71AF8B